MAIIEETLRIRELSKFISTQPDDLPIYVFDYDGEGGLSNDRHLSIERLYMDSFGNLDIAKNDKQEKHPKRAFDALVIW